MTPTTFLWHDYETFGAQPRRDRPAQFAAVRTDTELNEIGEPIMHYCRPSPDYLPDPVSCLITGITPQRCIKFGIPEYQFAARIEQALAQPGTIGAGYNSIRFDDEFTRFLFWRNLIDPYAREWQNQCGRWDLLDVVRTAYALRPEGIEWPRNAEGRASFRLEDLSAANGLQHEAAHDALSDVRATVALARLIRSRQPRLFDFCLSLRKKDRVMDEIGLPRQRPLLHISGMFAPEQGCLAIVWPLGTHPVNRNEVIVWDLAYDPSELRTLDADTIRLRMFTRSEELPEGISRLPIKTIHLNKSPIVIRNLDTLPAATAERWGIDMELALRNADIAASCGLNETLVDIWREVFRRPAETDVDVDEDLYGGFISQNDRRRLDRLKNLGADALTGLHPTFDDARLGELFFRYRARNFPDSLDADEQRAWHEHCCNRLVKGAGGSRTFASLGQGISGLMKDAHPPARAILEDVAEYAASMVECGQ
ncbi:MAG: exonuclease family protein [Paucimonas sp.]|nr:exonuclease family protein [Paucimonas sp.]